MSNIRDLIDVKVYEEFSKLLNKKEEKKPWYAMQLTYSQILRTYLLMLLAYPFLGPLVKWAVLKMW